jgi:hypothetical protein
MKTKFFLWAFFTGILALSSCEDNSMTTADYIAAADCTTTPSATNTYALTVKAILDASCATSGCHDATTKAHSLDLSTYDTAKASFQNHEVLCSINHGKGCDPMPEGGSKLSDAYILLLECWAKNNYPA